MIEQFIDSLTLIHGRHTIKFGAELKPRVDFSILQPPVPRGYFGFGGTNTAQNIENTSTTGLGTADFLLGAVSGGAQISSFINDQFQQPGQFYYVQDDIKVNRKLTLNLGLRYEFVEHAKERYNAEANFNVDHQYAADRGEPAGPTAAKFLPGNCGHSGCARQSGTEPER